MNSSKLRYRCRLMTVLLTVVFLAVMVAVTARTLISADRQNRLDSLTRGSVLDTSGTPLAWSDPGRTGTRHYPCGEAGSALVGYLSKACGSDGIERLCGDWMNPDEGDDSHGDVRLTVDGELMQACYDSIRDVPVAGAVVLDIETGAILSLVDTPSFAPERLDLDYEGIVSQGCVFYNICTGRNIAPGRVFALPACAAAVDAGDRKLAEDILYGSSEAGLSVSRFAVEDALRNNLLVGSTVTLDCMTLRSSFEAEDEKSCIDSLSGYGSAAVSPMQICMYTAALARPDGSIPKPYAISAMISRSGEESVMPSGEILAKGVFSAEARTLLKGAMTVYGDSGRRFAAMTSEVVTGSSDNVWLTAYAPAVNPRYALTLVMQGDRDSLCAEDAVTAAGEIMNTLL